MNQGSFKNSIVRQVILCTALCCMHAIGLKAQENPWVNRSTTNPWNSGETKKDTTVNVRVENPIAEKPDSVRLAKASATDSVQISDSLNISVNSASGQVLDSTKIPTDNMSLGIDNAVGGVSTVPLIAGSFFGGLIFNVFALPVTTIVAGAGKSGKATEEFIAENPQAGVEEIKQFKRKRNNKRVLHSALGTAAGALTNLMLLRSLFN